MKTHLIDTHLLVPRSRSSARVKVKHQGHVSQKMGVLGALVFHKHILFSIQLEVVAYDDLYPDDRATATVTITVNRNPGRPQFTDPNGPIYTRTIDEAFPVPEVVVDINATDLDGVRCCLFYQCYLSSILIQNGTISINLSLSLICQFCALPIQQEINV